MIIPNHVAAGVLIAVTVDKPWLAIPVAYISHFILDAVPHFGQRPDEDVFKRNKHPWFRRYIVIGGLVSLALTPPIIVLGVGHVSGFTLAACVVAAVSPDLVWIWRALFELKNKIQKPRGPVSEFHVRISHDSYLLGAVDEVVFMTVSICLILLAR